FSEGDAGEGILATQVPDWWLNMMQGEVEYPILQAGLTPSKIDWTQLYQAMVEIARANGVGLKDVSGCDFEWVGDDSAKITAGKCWSDDDSTLIEVASDLTFDFNNSNGPLGLDTGTRTGDTFYYLWLIHNPTTEATSVLASEDGTSPSLPSGYTKKRLLAGFHNNASDAIIMLRQFGTGRTRIFKYAEHSNADTLLVNAVSPAADLTRYSVDVSAYVPLTTGSRWAEIFGGVLLGGTSGSGSPGLLIGPHDYTSGKALTELAQLAETRPASTHVQGDDFSAAWTPVDSSGLFDYIMQDALIASPAVYLWIRSFMMVI
ncbi:MAG: hypothetical protein KC462_10165, partial [Cyanobacteria bacterium HKST-UBA05]|nr:hypothetical protein [Cyanobacteria bacterium HKST-UBA05]